MARFQFFKSIGEAILGEFKTAMIDRLSRVETKIDRIEKDVEEIKADVKHLDNRTVRLEAATVEIQSFLKISGAPICQQVEISAGSPLKVTPFGEDLAIKTDAYKFVDNNREFLFSLIDNKIHSTPYDVQVAARNILDEILSNPIMDQFKRFVFESGMEMRVVLNVAGIILRDKYLSTHPEIK